MTAVRLLPIAVLLGAVLSLVGCSKGEVPSAPSEPKGDQEPRIAKPPVPLPKDKAIVPAPPTAEPVPVTPADLAKFEAAEKNKARVEGPQANGGYQVSIDAGADALAILALLKGTKGIVGLTVEGGNLTSDALKCLDGFDYLESLILIRCDELTGFATLAPLPRLKSISIAGGAKLTDVGLRELAAQPALDTLSLDSVPVSGACFAIPGWAKLREISATNMPFNDAGLEAVAGFPVLESLDVHGTKVTDAGAKHLERAKSLTFLVLDNTGVGDAGLVPIAKLPALKELHLEDTKVTDAGVGALGDVNTLRVLNLEKTAITGSAFAKFAQPSALRKLNLNGTKFSDTNGPNLARFVALTNLSLIACPVTDAGLTSLGELKKLTNLNLSGTKTGDGIAKLAGALPQLELATFDDTLLTDAGLKDAAQGASLKFLYARNTKATKRGEAEAGKFAREGVKIVVE